MPALWQFQLFLFFGAASFWMISARSPVARCVTYDTPLTLWSPGGLKTYPAKTDRTWIFVGEAFKCLSIEFTVFDVEYSTDCTKDFVSVFDGPSTDADLLGKKRFCGNSTTLLKTTRNSVTIVFHTDSTNQRRGFEALITSTPCDPGARGRRTGSTPRCLGRIGSSLVTFKYPIRAPYRLNIRRKWAFISPARSCIEFTLRSFDVERSTDCLKDSINAYDGVVESSNQLMKMCGGSSAYARATGKTPTVVSSKNRILITFDSDQTIARAGFQAELIVKECPHRAKYGVKRKYHPSPHVTVTLMPPNAIVSPQKCGQPAVKPRELGNGIGRIVGGTIARAHSWPWQTSIRYQEQHTCGGSLISPRHVLTAAHCFRTLSEDPLDFEVWIGKHHKEKREAGKEQRLAVEQIILHPEYMLKADYDSDLAILRLAIPGAQVDYQYTEPICLPSHEKDADKVLLADNNTCYVTGFGMTKGTGGANWLKQAGVPIMNLAQCGRVNEELQPHLTENMVCAGYYEGGHDSCQGDSGGPLACKTDDIWHLGGVVSFGIDCGQANSPGVYVRVSKFISWIEDTAFDLVMP